MGILRFEGLEQVYSLATGAYDVALDEDEQSESSNPFLYCSGDVRLPNPFFSLWADVYIEPERILGTVTLRIPRNKRTWKDSNLYAMETYDFFQKWTQKIKRRSPLSVERRDMDLHIFNKEDQPIFLLALSEGLPQIDFHFGHQGCIEQKTKDVDDFKKHMGKNEAGLNDVLDILCHRYKRTRYVSFTHPL